MNFIFNPMQMFACSDIQFGTGDASYHLILEM